MRPTAIVTGASSGVGAATAEALARDGYDVILNFRSDADGAARTRSACEAAGAVAVTVRGDVADPQTAIDLKAAAIEKGGPLRVLVNNAGMTKHVSHADLDGLDQDDFARIYAVNVTGAFLTVQALRGLLDQGAEGFDTPSTIVNVASIAGVLGNGSSIAYAASKGALITMTRSLARALAPRIRVNAVSPGFIDTPWFTKGLGAETHESIREQVRAGMPLKTAMTPEQVAASIASVCATPFAYMTGENIVIDAGLQLLHP